MKVFTAQVQVDREIFASYPKEQVGEHAADDFTDEELQQMRAVVMHCCNLLEKIGYTRVQFTEN
jgi:hypothetical protein